MKLPLRVKDIVQVQMTGSNSAPYCDSRIEEMAADELLISWPTHAGERIRIRELQALRISFYRSQSVYEFDATVLDLIEDPIPLISIRPTGAPRTIQRRDDIRIRAHVSVELAARVVGLAFYKNAGGRKLNIKSETINLSAGGFSICQATPILEGTVFEVKLSLPGEASKIVTSAEVVRCVDCGESGADSPRFDIGFNFTRIGQSARARIVRFIFGLQREERMKE
jgi:c-di-GMP-binding flagellar brake protein YcgR